MREQTLSAYSLLTQHRLGWLGHVRKMKDCRMPKYLLHSELAKEKRSKECPLQCYRNVCKRDLPDCNIDITDWKTLAKDSEAWKISLKEGLSDFESKIREDV